MKIEVNLPVKDHPLDEIRITVRRLIADGGTVWQKWTCEKCGSRETQATPNVMLPYCECKCGHVTDIETRGCNYRLAMPL